MESGQGRVGPVGNLLDIGQFLIADRDRGQALHFEVVARLCRTAHQAPAVGLIREG